MILAVALNATVNVSYEAEEISWGAANPISRMTSRAGGGSLAVARVLAGLGEDVLVAGFAGGGAGDLIEADLARAGVATAFTRISRESRRVVEVLDEAREESTAASEPFVDRHEGGRFAGEFRKLVPGMDAVLSGARGSCRWTFTPRWLRTPRRRPCPPSSTPGARPCGAAWTAAPPWCCSRPLAGFPVRGYPRGRRSW